MKEEKHHECFVEKRQFAMPKEAFVELAISEEDQEKINSWGDKEFWASNAIELYLGRRSVVILNRKLAISKS